MGAKMAPKIPPALSLIAGLSSWITIVISLIYFSLSIFVLVYKNCDESIATTHFMHILYRVYFLDDKCEWKITLDYVTKTETVFTLTIITLCTSILSLITAIIFIVAIKYKAEIVLIAGYVYVALSLGSLVVDVTFATHFGLDSSAIAKVIDEVEILESIGLNLLQIGSIALMIITLKGFAVLIIIVVLLILIVIHLEAYRQIVNKNQHSRPRSSILYAYNLNAQDSTPNVVSTPHVVPTPNMLSAPALSRRSVRSSNHEDMEYIQPYSQPYNPSWQNDGHTAPFTYLRESATIPTPQSAEPGLRRDWQGPVVPLPDYSPQPRRLKSAMKPTPL